MNEPSFDALSRMAAFLSSSAANIRKDAINGIINFLAKYNSRIGPSRGE